MTHHVEHPGVLLKKKYLPLIEMGTNAMQLSRVLQLPRGDVAALLRGKKDIDDTIARELGRLFNTSPLLWKALQEAYDHAQVEFER